MKKLFSVLSAVVLLVISSVVVAEASNDFEWRNIRFGMTPEEIKSIETLPFDGESDGFIVFGKGTVGIDVLWVRYELDDEKKLMAIEIRYNDNPITTVKDYYDIEAALTLKYGEPVGDYAFKGRELRRVWLLYTMGVALEAETDIKTEERIMDCGDYKVKIDHIYFFGYDGIIEHVIQYTRFTDEDAVSILG